MENQAEFTFACPHCGQHLAAEPDMVGMELECPSCGKRISVPGPDKAEAIGKKPETKAEQPASDAAVDGATDNPFAKDWDSAKEKARAGGEAAKEFSKKAWQASKEYGKVGGEAAKEFSKKAWTSSKEYGTKVAKSKRFKNACAALKAMALFCLASVWFVLRGIGIGIGRTVSFALNKVFKKHPLKLSGIVTRAKWIWARTLLPIDLRWRKYESCRSECADGSSVFSAMSMGRRLACTITGCAILAVVISQFADSDDDDDYQCFDNSSHASSSSSSSSSSESHGTDHNEIETRRLKSGVEKVLLSKYAYDADEITAAGDRTATSARRSEIWDRLLERAIQLPSGKWLFHSMPDGRFFQVALVARTTDPPGLLGIRLGGVVGDGTRGNTKGWEYHYTIGNLLSDSSGLPEDFYWDGAPWAWQTGERNKQFAAENAPFLSGGLSMLLPDSGKMEKAIEKLNAGSFVKSNGWVLGIRLTKPDGTSFSTFQYAVFPSLKIAAQIAGLGITDEVPIFETIPPRDKKDIVLRKMQTHGHCMMGLASLLREVERILPDITLGKAFKHLVEMAVPLGNDFKVLIGASGGNDKEEFKRELKKTISILEEMENRDASAKYEPGFDKFALDEDAAEKYEIAYQSQSLNSLWPRQSAVFHKIWEDAYSSREFKDYIRCAWQAFPDDVSFFVKDVKDGNRHFNMVFLEPLKYGKSYKQTVVPMMARSSIGDSYLKDVSIHNQNAPKENLDDDGHWKGDSRQGDLFWRYMSEKYGGGSDSEFLLRTSKSEKDYLNLKKGDVVKSGGWIREILIENSVATGPDGKQGETRKIHFRSSHEAGKNSRMLYSSARTRLEIEESIRKSHEND